MRRLIQSLRDDLSKETERGQIGRSGLGTAMLRGGALVLAFGASLLYARVLGPHDYGLYAYVLAWSAVLTIPASLGLPQYLVREGSRYPRSHRWLLRWSDRRIVLSGLAAGVLMSCAALIPAAAGARWLFVIVAPLPLLTNLAATRQALIQSRGQIVRSQWAQMLLAPSLMLAGLLLICFWHDSLTPIDLAVMMVGTALAPLLINHWLVRSTSGAEDMQTAPISMRPALAFMWLGMLYLINSRTDLIMLGALKGAHAAGIYAIASRASELTMFFLAASNAVIAPRISRLHHQGEAALLQRLVRGASVRVALLTLPIVLVLIFLARPLLALFYGEAFAIGTLALQVLVFGYFFSVLAGPTGTILTMTGNERLSAIGVGISVFANIVLNAVLIPRFGIVGAATATASSLVIWNALLWYWVRRRLMIRPTAIGL